MADYLLPDVGEGLTEAEIVTWRVKEGDVDRDQRHRRRDRDRQVAGRAAVAVRRHRDRAARRRGRDRRGRHADHLDRRPPATAPAPAARAARRQDIGEIDLSNPAASGGGEGESLVGRNKADRGPLRRPRKGSASPEHRGRCGHPDAAPGCVRPRRRAVGRRSSRPTSRPSRRTRPPEPASRPRATPRPGQAAGAQAGQGPRRRPDLADRHRSAGSITRDDVSGGAGSGADVIRSGCPGDHARMTLRASASAASRSRACAR